MIFNLETDGMILGGSLLMLLAVHLVGGVVYTCAVAAAVGGVYLIVKGHNNG